MSDKDRTNHPNYPNQLHDWISERIGGKQPVAPPLTDYQRAGGENPQLHAFVAEKMGKPGERPTQAEPNEPTDREPTARETAAWGLLDDATRAACLEGDAAALAAWKELAQQV